MATSLASQLQRLSTAQTALYERQRRTKVSFLFDSRKAAEFDIDTYHAIGQSGFKELAQLQPAIQIHWRNLFSDAAKDYERAMQDAETNRQIDAELEQFVHKITPYFLVRPCHKVIEWLIQRFHVQTFNIDLLMRLVLPYHQSNYFVRLIQVLDVESKDDTRWLWLAAVRKEGMPLTLSNVVDRCFSDNRFFDFVCDSYHRITTGDDEVSNEIQLKFLTALFVNVVEQYAAALQRKSSAVAARKASKLQLKSLYRGLLPAVQSGSASILSSAYIILLRMHALMELDEKLLSAVVNSLLALPVALAMPETLIIVAVFLSKMVKSNGRTSVASAISRIIDTDTLFDGLPIVLRQKNMGQPHVVCLNWLAEAILFHLAEILVEVNAGEHATDDNDTVERRKSQFSVVITKIFFIDSTIQQLLNVLTSKLPRHITADGFPLVDRIGTLIAIVYAAYPQAWPEFVKTRMTRPADETEKNGVFYGVAFFEQLQALQRTESESFKKLASIAIVAEQVAMIVKTEQLSDVKNQHADSTWKAACIAQIVFSLRDTESAAENKSVLAVDLCRILEKSVTDPSTVSMILAESSLLIQLAGETAWKNALLQFFSNFFEQCDFWHRLEREKYEESMVCLIDVLGSLCKLTKKVDISTKNDEILAEAHAVVIALLFSLPSSSSKRVDLLMRLEKLPYFLWLRAPAGIAIEASQEKFSSSSHFTRLLCRRLLSCNKNYIDYALTSILSGAASEKSSEQFGERFAFHALNISSMCIVAQQQQKRSSNFESIVVLHLRALNAFVERVSADVSSQDKKEVSKSTELIDLAEQKFLSARKIDVEIFSGWAHATLAALFHGSVAKSKKIPDFLAPLPLVDESESVNVASTTRHHHQQTTYQTYLLELCRLAFVTLDSPRKSQIRAVFLALLLKRIGNLVVQNMNDDFETNAAAKALFSVSAAVTLLNNMLRCLIGGDVANSRQKRTEVEKNRFGVINRALAFFTATVRQLNLPTVGTQVEKSPSKLKLAHAACNTAAAELENSLQVLLFLTLPLVVQRKAKIAGDESNQTSSTTAHLIVDLLSNLRSRIKTSVPRRLLKTNLQALRFIRRVVLNVEMQELIGGDGENVLCNSISQYATAESSSDVASTSGRSTPTGRSVTASSTLDSLIAFCMEPDLAVDSELKSSFLPLLAEIQSPNILMPLFQAVNVQLVDHYSHKKSPDAFSAMQMSQISSVLHTLGALHEQDLLGTKSFAFSGLVMQILQLAAADSTVMDENFVEIYRVLLEQLSKKSLFQSISPMMDDETRLAAATTAQHMLIMQILRVLSRHEKLQTSQNRKIYTQTLSWLTMPRNIDLEGGRRRRMDTALAVRVLNELVTSLNSVVEEQAVSSATPDDEIRQILLGRAVPVQQKPEKNDSPVIQSRMLVILLQVLAVNPPKKSGDLNLLLEPLCRAMRLLAALLPSILPNAVPPEQKSAVDHSMDVDADDLEAKLERDFLLSLGNCLRLLTMVLKKLKNSDQPFSAVDLLPVNEVMRCIERVKHAGIVRLALALLTHIADRAPLNVLHQSMTLFAFMGSHMAHREDEWSLSVLTSTLKCLIPTLMRSCCAGENENADEEQKSAKQLSLAVKIIGTFLDALPHFAPHYVQPVLSAIVKALGRKQYLWLFSAMLVRTYIQHQCALNDDEIESSRRFQVKWPPAFSFMLEEFYLNNDAFSQSVEENDGQSSSAVDTATEDDETDKNPRVISRTTPQPSVAWQSVRVAADSLLTSGRFSPRKRTFSATVADSAEEDDLLQAFAAEHDANNDCRLTAADLLYNIQQLVELSMQLPANDMAPATAEQKTVAKLPKFLRTVFSTAFFTDQNAADSSDSGRKHWRKSGSSNIIEYDHDSREIMQMNRLRLGLVQFVQLLVSSRAVWADKNLSLLSDAVASETDEAKRLKSNTSALLFTLNRTQVFARDRTTAISAQLQSEMQQEPATTTDEDEEAVAVDRSSVKKRRRQRNSDSVRSYQEAAMSLFYENYETSAAYWKSLYGGAVHQTTTTLLSVIPAKFFVRVATGFVKGSVMSVVRNGSGLFDAVENALELITEALMLRGEGKNNEISSAEASASEEMSYSKLINVFLDIIRDKNFVETEKSAESSSTFMFPAKCKAVAVGGLSRLCRMFAVSPAKSKQSEDADENSAALLIIDSLAEETTNIFAKITSETHAENEKLDDIVTLHALLDASLLIAHKMQPQYLKLIHTTTQRVLHFLLADAENNPILIGEEKFTFATTSKTLQKLAKQNPWQFQVGRRNDENENSAGLYRHYTQSLRSALQFLTLHVKSFPQFLSTRALEQIVQLCWKFQHVVRVMKTNSASPTLRIRGRYEIDKLAATLFEAVEAGTIEFRAVLKVFSTMQRSGEFKTALDDSSKIPNDNVLVLSLPLSLLSRAVKVCQTKELFAAATDVAQLLFNLLSLCANHEKMFSDQDDAERMLNLSTLYAPLFELLLSFSMSISPLMFQHLITRLTTWSVTVADTDETVEKSSVFVQFLFVLNATARLSGELRSAFVHLAQPVLELIMDLLRSSSETGKNDESKKNLVDLKSLSAQKRLAIMNPLYATLHNMILNDRQEFFDKIRVEALLKCVFNPFRQSDAVSVDIRGHLQRLTSEHVGPMLVALGSGSAAHYRDVYVRDLHEQLCELAGEHKSAAVRECALRILLTLMQSASFVSEFQTLLPDTAQALHQVMEDDDTEVLKICNDLLKQAEKIHGEPISDLMS